MANLNRVFLIGNLTRDPELRVTPKGSAICSFGLAMARTWKNEAGEQQEETTFVDVEAWGRQGETIAKHVTKGRPLFVEGRLRFDQWEDKTSGQKRSKLKVVLESFQFLGGRDGAPGESGSAGSESGSGARDTAPPPRRAAPEPTLHPDDDVPF